MGGKYTTMGRQPNCGRKRYIYGILTKNIRIKRERCFPGHSRWKRSWRGGRKEIIRFVHTTKDRRQDEEPRVKTFR